MVFGNRTQAGVSENDFHFRISPTLGKELELVMHTVQRRQCGPAIVFNYNLLLLYQDIGVVAYYCST
jgi:hypothetical protein